MKNSKGRLIAAIIVMGICAFLYWLGGGEFTQRGEGLAFTAFVILVSGLLGYTNPFMD